VQDAVGAGGVDEPVEGGEVVSWECVGGCLAESFEDGEGVATDGVGGGAYDLDVEDQLVLQREAGGGQLRSPVGAAVRHVLGLALLEGSVAAFLEPGTGLGRGRRQEAGEPGELDDGDQPAGGEDVADLAQRLLGVGQVVHRGGRPDEVGCAEVGPVGGVEIGVHGVDAVAQAGGVRLGPQLFEVCGGRVDSREVGSRELAEEGEGAGAGSGTEVHDPHGWGADGQPGGDSGDVLGQHLGVQVQDLCLAVVMGVRAVVGVLGVPVAVACGNGVVMVTGQHAVDARSSLPERQASLQDPQGTVVIMSTEQPVDQPDPDLSQVVRQRIRGLRQARGWNLDALAARCHMSPSTLSRIETGQRSIGLQQLVPLARALGTTIDHLVESEHDEDVVIHPVAHREPGVTTWLLSRDSQPGAPMVAKMRITSRRQHGPGALAVHPGKEWFTVLSGRALLHLGERRITVETGQAAEFSTMTPHSVGAVEEPVEILTIFDADGERAHHQAKHLDEDGPA